MKPGPRSVGAAAGLAMASGWAAEARAERAWTTDAGVFVSYHFGAGAPGHFGAGLEVRHLNMQQTDCSEADRFAGGVARIQLVGWDHVRLVVGPQLGKNDGFTEVAADLSIGYGLGRDPGLILEPGFEGAFVVFKARLAYAITRDISAGTGMRIPRGFAQGCTVEGRPLRREGGVALLPGAVLIDGRTGRTPPPAPTAAMTFWAQRARAEWASAPAFCELAQQLEACGAPPALSARARDCAEDEVRHAVIASTVTATLGGRAVSLEPPALDCRAPATGAAGLVRLATESWTDGCLGEAVAAASLHVEAERAPSHGLRQAQRTIAEDEARHAELAWDVLAWALAKGGAPVRSALASPVETTPVETASEPAPALPGCVSSGERRALAAGVRAEALERLASMTHG